MNKEIVNIAEISQRVSEFLRLWEQEDTYALATVHPTEWNDLESPVRLYPEDLEALADYTGGDRSGSPSTFYLDRTVDYSGVSGTGIVADGIVFPDGHVAVRWRGERSSTVLWDSVSDMTAVHGHGGATKVVWA